jgi:hypothetical protein
MNAASVRISLCVAAVLLVAGPQQARAQAPLEPAQMSPRTAFYVIWRGVPGPEIRKANSLLALWEDTDFAPVRSALAGGMLGSSGEKSAQPKMTSQEVQEFAGLLENSFTLGYMTEPLKRAVPKATASNSGSSAEPKTRAWSGMFFVYDRSGKELLLAKAILRLRAEEKETPVLSQVTIEGVPVIKAESKSGASYWAEHGKYAVGASERTVMEEILGRLDGKVSGVASLAQSAAYQEAQPNLAGGLLEFFLGIPGLENLAADSKAGAFQMRKLLEAAKLDAVHSISGHVTFEGARTHVQAAILGDAVPGTPFDIWSAGVQAPASLAFAPAEAISYTSTQLDFMGIYDTVKRVAHAALPQSQQGNADLLDTLAQQRIGMPLPEALGLLTGEFASLQTSPSMDNAKQVYFFGIRKKPETLKLMRAVFSEKLTTERNEGDVTFLKISLGGKEGGAGVAQWNFFNLAITPNMILGANRIETLRETLAYRANAANSAGLASVARFQAGRAQFPVNLSGFSYFDFQKIDWQVWKDRLVEEEKKGRARKSGEPSENPIPTTATEQILQINAQVFSRHLHYSSSVSWKDSKGIHWDQWIE